MSNSDKFDQSARWPLTVSGDRTIVVAADHTMWLLIGGMDGLHWTLLPPLPQTPIPELPVHRKIRENVRDIPPPPPPSRPLTKGT